MVFHLKTIFTWIYCKGILWDHGYPPILHYVCIECVCVGGLYVCVCGGGVYFLCLVLVSWLRHACSHAWRGVYSQEREREYNPLPSIYHMSHIYIHLSSVVCYMEAHDSQKERKKKRLGIQFSVVLYCRRWLYTLRTLATFQRLRLIIYTSLLASYISKSDCSVLRVYICLQEAVGWNLARSSIKVAITCGLGCTRTSISGARGLAGSRHQPGTQGGEVGGGRWAVVGDVKVGVDWRGTGRWGRRAWQSRWGDYWMDCHGAECVRAPHWTTHTSGWTTHTGGCGGGAL